MLGAVAGGLVLLGYGTAPALVSLAIAIAVAPAAGGAVGGVPWPAVVVAGVVGQPRAVRARAARRAVQRTLREAIARDDSVAAQYAAIGQIAFAMALLGGVAAGLTASLVPAPQRRGLKWPAHLAAGATPGLLLLVGRRGDADRRRAAAERVSGNDTSTSARTGAGGRRRRLSTALVVLFAGAMVAIIVHAAARSAATRGNLIQLGRVVPLQFVVLSAVDGELRVGVAGDRLVDHGGGRRDRLLGVGAVDVDRRDRRERHRAGAPRRGWSRGRGRSRRTAAAGTSAEITTRRRGAPGSCRSRRSASWAARVNATYSSSSSSPSAYHSRRSGVTAWAIAPAGRARSLRAQRARGRAIVAGR